MLSKITSRQLRTLVSGNKLAQFSTWSALESAPPDAILGLNDSFKKETNPKKVLLGMGVYRDNDNKPYVLNCIRKAEEIIFKKHMDHEYAGIQGIDSFVANVLKLAYGENSAALKDGFIAGA